MKLLSCTVFQNGIHVSTNSHSSTQQQDQIELYERCIKCILLSFVWRRVHYKVQFATALRKDAYASEKDKYIMKFIDICIF